MGRKIVTMAISGLLGLFLIALAPVALATTVEECVGLIEELDTALDGVEIRGRHPAQTRASLESKLGGASTKTNQAKFCAAIGKLDDFESKVGDLAVANRKGETKMDPADAAMLQADAAEAISCLLDLDPSCL